MYCQYPVRKEDVLPLLNRPVEVITLNGSSHFGILTGCEDGQLVLNGSSKSAKTKAGVKTKRRRSRSQTKGASAAPPPSEPRVPYGSPLLQQPRQTLDLSKILFLSVLLP